MRFIYKYLPIMSVLLVMLLLDRALADVKPNPLTGGKNILGRGDEIDDVRMFDEEVLVRIFRDRIETVADFCMINEGETVTMEVGFPYSRPEEFIEFRAFVNGVEVEVRDSEHLNRKQMIYYWKLWDMTFYKDNVCNIRVEYITRPYGVSHIWLRNSERYSRLSRDVMTELDYLTRHENVEYILSTGSYWKGILDKCRIVFRLEDFPLDHITDCWPKDAKRTENEVIWEYTDYEPQGRVSIGYYPNIPAIEMAPYLFTIARLYQDEPSLANYIGRMIDKDDERALWQDKIYRERVDEWDGSIPDLLKRNPDGSCAFDYECDDQFYTIWGMVSFLLYRYQKDDRIHKSKEIAPVLSKQSGAIIEALESCNDLIDRDRRLLEEARAMRKFALSLIED